MLFFCYTPAFLFFIAKKGGDKEQNRVFLEGDGRWFA